MTNAKEPAWESAYEGTANRLVFDTPGDQWIGYWEGFEDIENEKTEEVYVYATFRSPDDNERYQISASYALRKGLENVPKGALTRLTFLKEVDTSNGKQAPMKDMKVEYQPVS